MNAGTKIATYILSIVLALSIIASGIYVLVRSSVTDKNSNPVEATITDTPTDTQADKPADTPTGTQADKPADTPTDTPADKPADEPADEPTDDPKPEVVLQANEVTISGGKDLFEKEHTGEELPIVLGEDFSVKMNNDVTILYLTEDKFIEVRDSSNLHHYDLMAKVSAAGVETAPKASGVYFVYIGIASGNGFKNFEDVYSYKISASTVAPTPIQPVEKKENSITILSGKDYFEKVSNGAKAVSLIKGIDFKTASDSDVVSVYYKLAGNKPYTTVAPTENGNYYKVKIEVKESNEYKALTAYFDFKVVKLTEATLPSLKNMSAKVTKTYTGEPLAITKDDLTFKLYSVSGGFSEALENDEYTAEFEYKKSEKSDDYYASYVPTEAGKYVVRITVPTTEKFQGGIFTINYEIVNAA
ncbi:MAG: hypothetical protein IJ837_02290 [Clostridia bacterium]|nr:hypothetical protein [Clostridia bacterium]